MADARTSLLLARLERTLNGVLTVLAVEFFLGIWLNLFGTFPGAGFGPALTDTADPVLIAHIVVGILMFVNGAVVLGLSFASRTGPLRWFAAAGLFGILLAGASGGDFVSTGYTDNVASFTMAVGFSIALTAYYQQLLRLRTARARAAAGPAAPVAA